MPHFIHRSWLLAGVVVVAALVGAAAAVRWALDPFLLKTLAQSRLSTALGQPVRIGTVRLSFFPPLTVYGTDIAVGEGARAGGASLDIRAIRMHPRLSSILSRPSHRSRGHRRPGVARTSRPVRAVDSAAAQRPDQRQRRGATTARFDVAEVTLKNGRLTIAEDHPAGRGASAITTPIDSINATVHRTGGVTPLDALTASVGRSRVAGSGSVGHDGLRLTLRWTDLKAADMPLVFALLGSSALPGCRWRARTAGAGPARRCERRHLCVRQNCRGPGGAWNAGHDVVPVACGFREQSPDARPDDVPGLLRQRTRPTDREPQLVAARLDPRSRGAAPGHRPVSEREHDREEQGVGRGFARRATARHVAGADRANRSGAVAVNIANGAIRDFPLLSAIYSALRIGAAGDRDLHFQTLSATFAIADARASTTDLVARTGDLTLGAAGTIGLESINRDEGHGRVLARQVRRIRPER